MKDVDPYQGVGASNTTKSSMFPVQGVDVSKYQGSYDWDAAMQEGNVKFGFTRASVGAGTLDEKFRDNWQAMAERKLLRGAYHFAYPSSVAAGKTVEDDAYDEAMYFCEVLRSAEQLVNGGKPMYDGLTLPPVLDYEQSSPWSKDEKRAWINEWILTVQKELERGVIIYTGDNTWSNELDGDPWLTGLPLWVPHYSNGTEPGMKPWTSWVLWQWSGGGDNGDTYKKLTGEPFPGANGSSVDVNAFWGSEEDLRLLGDPLYDRWMIDSSGTIGKNPHADSGSSRPPGRPPGRPPTKLPGRRPTGPGGPTGVDAALAKLHGAQTLIDAAIKDLES